MTRKTRGCASAKHSIARRLRSGGLGLLAVWLVACRADTPTLTPPIGPPPNAVATQVQTHPLTDERGEERLQMVQDTIEARGITDTGVLAAMRSVPRHLFVPDPYAPQAYEDHPLPIGYGQTISQPYIVAWMTELLALNPGEKVLEIGTGSGYQAAVLAHLHDVEVYSIEIVPELAQRAEETLSALGYTEVRTRQGDGYYGWAEAAPFDAILVTAAPDHLPQPLVQQLTADGRLVIPIGPPGGYQSLWRFTMQDGELVAENLGGVRFVPFTGEGSGRP
jgi:protein-L-isoaspartate(D-aspartate) O-methyltransferase